MKTKTKKGALSMYGRVLPEKVESLPREVLKWIQSLDLTYSVKNVKKDFNNGFLVAQILSRYYPVTNDQQSNYKAIQMHQIDNGFSMARRKDNWIQIQKFLSKITEITTRIDDVDTFIKNENGEILIFIMSLYQELTKRHLPLLDGKFITTDIDNINKSYLLKENGEIELLKKNALGIPSSPPIQANNLNIPDLNQGATLSDQAGSEKKVEDVQKTQKTSTSLLSKTGNVVMKGDVKPMANQPTQMEKGFKVKISEPKIFEQPTRTMYQIREQDTKVQGVGGGNQKNELDSAVYNSLFQSDRELETKASSTDNPFLTLGEPLANKFQCDFQSDYGKIRFTKGSKFINDYFRNVEFMSDESLDLVLKCILKIIEDFYNILSGKQCNDYIDTFLTVYAAYIRLDHIEDDKKFLMMHEGMLNFFSKSLKNKNEEMFFIFREIFVEKLFETINDKEYIQKLPYLCELLFHILDPTDEQQVDLFKMFKKKIPNEETLYECFAILHNKLNNHFTDSLIDGCLFYILNGFSSENPRVRYFSLYILLKYAVINVNFVMNFANKIQRLAVREKDRENCLLIIKIVAQTLKAAYIKKTSPNKDQKKGTIITSSPITNNNNNSTLDKNGEIDPESLNYLNEISYANRIITQIINRFMGDHIFILLFTTDIYEYLYDNTELYKVLLTALFSVNDSVHKYMFYDDELDDEMRMKYEWTIFRTPLIVEKIKQWNKPMLFKAFDSLLMEREVTELSEGEYNFIKFLTKDGLDVTASEIWKNSFNFSNLVIQDLNKLDKVFTCLSILDAFITCEPIQKYIFDEWYDNMNKVFLEIIDLSPTNDDAKKCEDAVRECLEGWIKNMKISQIVRDDVRKLMEVFPKEQKEDFESST